MSDLKNIDTKEKEAAYKLINIPGIGNQSAMKLIDYTRNAQKALQLPEDEIREILGMKAAEAFIKGRENLIETSIEQLEKKRGFRFIPYTSREYPEKLRHIANPPFALYVRGELPAEDKPAVAIIGARACSEYGKSMARHFGKQLGALGIPIISGMAQGIDGIAQQGALDGGGTTYGVLGCGVDVCYPPENESLYHNIIICGGIISEYPPGTKAQSALFPQRNRIISGLSDVLLVIEARKRSGTYITVTQALEQGKEVYAVPGRVTDNLSEGCNYLLSQGAGVAINPEVIIQEIMEKQTYFDMDRRKDTDKKRRTKQSIENKQNIEGMQNISKNNKRLENINNTEIVMPSYADPKTKNNYDNGKEISYNHSLREAILSVLDITPLDTEFLYQKIKASYEITMEELLLELTKMQIAGVIIGEGNYYRLFCAL